MLVLANINSHDRPVIWVEIAATSCFTEALSIDTVTASQPEEGLNSQDQQRRG
jgi:hypothetical protein